MSEGKRIRRTPEQIVADLDVQIEKLKDQIKLLVRQAQKSGMKLDEIADKLGMALPE